MRRPAAWTLVALVAVLAVAGWLRFAELGRLSLWADEFPHAIAAERLIEEGRPVLPSGREYRRALGQTVAISASMRAFGESETPARLPSALAGLATIPLLWLVVRRRFGDVAALAAAAALAVMPLHVAHSRSARFYVAFALAYGAAAVLGSRALETGSRRAGVAAVAAFAVALHLQIAGLMLLAALAVYAASSWWRAHGAERRSRSIRLGIFCGALVAGGLVIALVPPMRDGIRRLMEQPVPGLELSPGLHLRSLARLFEIVAWWAWIPLVPAVLVGLRHAGRQGWNLALHLLVPAILVSVLFVPTGRSRVIDLRYLLHLVPFLAAVVGVGIAELLRAAGAALRRVRSEGRPRFAWAGPVVAVALGALVVAGAVRVASLPSADHPGRIVPRANWRLGGATVAAGWREGDALLTTAPLAASWYAGRCGTWFRIAAAAEPYIDGGRDVYCGTQLVADVRGLERFFTANPRGWFLADAAGWRLHVDPASRALISSRASAVPVADETLVLFRWS